VLQTLTTISKRVMRVLKEAAAAAAAPEPVRATPPARRAPVPAPPVRPAPAAAPAPAAPTARRGPQADLEAALAGEARHPQAARAAATAAAASAALDASDDLLRSAAADSAELLLAAEPEGAGAAPLTIESVGEARKIGPGALRVPVVLRDAEGRLHKLTLTLAIGPASGEDLT
jgi:hypothetical protein